ncbi:MAG: shikimate kinase [Candidatus Kuenenia sp.]|nr:shikimate kinase [Candidatus Kuenenia hertensis]
MNIFLIGFRGTGKSFIGKILAQRLNRKYIDADEYLEQKEGKTIKDIFAESGEETFREIESRVIAELCMQNNLIVATGGGVVLNAENVGRMKKCGVAILLEADADTLFERIKGDVGTKTKRPSLTQYDGYQEIKYLLEKRKPSYGKAADFVVNTAQISADETVNKIMSFIENYVKDTKDEL